MIDTDDAMCAKGGKGERVLFLAGDAPFLVSHRINLVEGAISEGFAVSVACPFDLEAVERIRGCGAEWVEWKVKRGGMSPIAEFASFLGVLGIAARRKPALVHAVGVKYILHAGVLTSLLATPLIGAISGLGYLYTGNATLGKRLLRRVVSLFMHFWLNRSNVTLIFQNSEDAQLVRWAHLDRVTVQTIPGSGVDLGRIVNRPLPSGNATRVGLPARLLRDKGIYEFVDAARLLKERGSDAELLLIGNPDPANPTSISRSEIEAWIDEGIIDWIPHTSDISSVLAGLHVVALPSYREGFPKTLIDAAAAGRAAVATDVIGCRDAVIEGKTGLLCPPKDSSALAAAIERLTVDRQLCAAMGIAARSHAERNFDIREVTRRHMQIYRASLTGAN